MNAPDDLPLTLSQAEEKRKREVTERVERDHDGAMSIDGVISPQTRELMRRLGATAVSMTNWWVRTPQRWVCTGCGRPKSEIARVTESGVLLCRMSEHHDHMQDLLLKRFHHYSSTIEGSTANGVAKSFAKRSAAMISAYENTIVCDDCNTADATAKALAKTHPDFSFSAAEMRRFLVSSPNANHRVDPAAARIVWEEAKETFELRLRIVDRIAQIAAKDEHWFQPTEIGSRPRDVTARSSTTLGTFWGAAFDALRGTTPVDRSEAPSDLSAWRKKAHPLARVHPTDGEISDLRRVDSAEDWNSVEDAWRCPGCERPKRETVRKNNDGRFFFVLNSSSERSKVAPFKPLRVCHDCGLTARDMGREALKRLGINQSEYSQHVLLSEVRRVVKPRPYSRHLIDNDDADVVIAEMMERLNAEATDDIEWE